MKKIYLKLIIILVIILLIAIIFVLNGNFKIKEIIDDANIKIFAENIEEMFDYTIYSNNNDNVVINIKVSSPKGISKIIFPNNEKIIDCYGKNKVSIDYRVNLDTQYEFKAVNQSGEEITKLINISQKDIENIANIKVSIEEGATISDVANLRIEYEENDLLNYNEYKIGENGIWKTYSEPIEINSYDIYSNKLQNEDNTITVYARKRDKNNNAVTNSQIVSCLDLEFQSNPEINIVTSGQYPVLTAYGMGIQSTVNIMFDENYDTNNYYSIDGENWNIYTGTLEISCVEVFAKSIKKNSGLETSSKKIAPISNLASNALGPLAYDSSNNTAESFSSMYGRLERYVLIDPSVFGKTIRYYASGSGRYGSTRVEIVNDEGTVIREICRYHGYAGMGTYGWNGTFVLTDTNSKWILISTNRSATDVYNINLEK